MLSLTYHSPAPLYPHLGLSSLLQLNTGDLCGVMGFLPAFTEFTLFFKKTLIMLYSFFSGYENKMLLKVQTMQTLSIKTAKISRATLTHYCLLCVLFIVYMHTSLPPPKYD